MTPPSFVLPRIMDGGTGTELERSGAPMNSRAWSAEAVLTHPEFLREIHASFIRAGAELVIANTFSAALHNLEAAGLGASFKRINSEAVRLARQAVEMAGGTAMTAGALSTTTFSGALDYSVLPSGDRAVERYAEQAEIQAESGAEIMILEMMRDIDHTALALEGALRCGLPVWVGFTCFTGDDNETYLLDTDIPLKRALTEIPLQKAHAAGIMHTLVEHTQAAFQELKSLWGGPTFAYPHAGFFRMPNWIFNDAITPQDFADAAMQLFEMGADTVGGCCGITPTHIAALRSAVENAQF